jgi:hypothetical protein
MFGRLRGISQLDGGKVFASLNHGQHTLINIKPVLPRG